MILQKDQIIRVSLGNGRNNHLAVQSLLYHKCIYITFSTIGEGKCITTDDHLEILSLLPRQNVSTMDYTHIFKPWTFRTKGALSSTHRLDKVSTIVLRDVSQGTCTSRSLHFGSVTKCETYTFYVTYFLSHPKSF